MNIQSSSYRKNTSLSRVRLRERSSCLVQNPCDLARLVKYSLMLWVKLVLKGTRVTSALFTGVCMGLPSYHSGM